MPSMIFSNGMPWWVMNILFTETGIDGYSDRNPLQVDK